MASPYEQMRAGYTAVCQAATGISGVLRIGMYSPVSAGPDFVEIVGLFETRHPLCHVEVIDTGVADPIGPLRRGDVEMVATRLPADGPDLKIGPILSDEVRVVAVARDHPFVGRESVSYEEVADYAVSDPTEMPRELIDDFVPPRTPAGRVLRRVPVRSAGDVLMAVAAGKIVHPTVSSFADHHAHPGVTTVLVHDLPPSRTALVAIVGREYGAAAFARAAQEVRDRVADRSERASPAR